jgi:hypothetical protein
MRTTELNSLAGVLKIPARLTIMHHPGHALAQHLLRHTRIPFGTSDCGIVLFQLSATGPLSSRVRCTRLAAPLPCNEGTGQLGIQSCG